MDSRPVALVTGSARRLGRSIALELARHGWDIAVHYRASAQDAQATVDELHALGIQAHAFAADLSDEAACRALLPAVAGHFGRVDAVVNNASVFEYDDALNTSVATMERHWRANTAPAILLAQALHAHLSGRQATGCVINLLDQKLWNPNPDHFSYTLSKAALQCATTMLAMALAPVLRVCGVAPGLVLGSEQIDDKRLARLQAASPLGRGASPEDIARAVHFLATSPGITGAMLLVDAGQHLQPMSRDFAFANPRPL